MRNKGTILAVDDYQPNLLLIVDMLTIEGYNVLQADSGKQALAVLENNIPDLILLDVMMPEMSGIELCKTIKQNNEWCNIPVVFLTAAVSIDDRVAGLNAGAVDYILKPFQIEEFLVRVSTYIQLSKLKSEQKILKGTIIENEQLLNEIGQLARIGGWKIEYPSQKYTWTKEVYRIHEVSEDYIPTLESAINFYTENSIPILTKLLDDARFLKKPFEVELEMITAKGNHRFVKIVGNIKLNEIGETAVVYGSFQNITKRKLANMALLHAAEEWQLTFDSSPDAISIIDTSHKIIRCNQAMKELTRSRNGDLIQKKCFEKIHGTNCPIENCPLDKALISKKREILEIHQNNFWYEVIVDPIIDDKNEIIHLNHIIRNITDRKKAEKQIMQLNKTLKKKNAELEQLVYLTSHDLRSPLVNIQGFSDELVTNCKNLIELLPGLIDKNTDFEKIKQIILNEVPEALFYIKQSCVKMDILIEGLLKVSRLGRLKLDIVPVSMNKLVADVLAFHEYKIKTNEIIVKVGDLPECMADEKSLNQVVSNLIDNAIKFMPANKEKQICISGFTENGQSIYCFADNGKGIKKAQIENVFVIFQKEDQESQGEGLGLTIAAKIIEKHNGKIWVESQENNGSSFFIKLNRQEDLIDDLKMK